MIAMAIPVLPDKVDTWRAWAAELRGPRRAEFEAFNARYELTTHKAWAQVNPDGSVLAIVVVDGPGQDGFMAAMMASSDPFDQWFIGTVMDVHGMDASTPPPPPAEQIL